MYREASAVSDSICRPNCGRVGYFQDLTGDRRLEVVRAIMVYTYRLLLPSSLYCNNYISTQQDNQTIVINKIKSRIISIKKGFKY